VIDDARMPVHDALVQSSTLPLPLLCDAALFALRSRTLHVLQRSAPPLHILPTALCNLTMHSLCVRSLEHNFLDEQAKLALRNAWRGTPSHLEL